MYLYERKLIPTQQFGTYDYNLLLAENQFILDRAKIKLYFQAFWVHILFIWYFIYYIKVFIIAVPTVLLEKGSKWIQ